MLEGDYFFVKPTEFDAKTLKKKWKEQTPALIADLADVFKSTDDWSEENIEVVFKSFLEDKEVGMGAVLPNFRLVVTGKGMGPSMFAIAKLLGKEETIGRMGEGIEKLK
jgi:glutamyl-tRNA synthetase